MCSLGPTASAHAQVRKNPGDRSPIELADVFSRQARRRVEDRFGAVFNNDDIATYKVARKVLDGAYPWLEEGIIKG